MYKRQTDEIAHIILNQVIPNPSLGGLYHVSSNPISKHNLLAIAKDSFKKDIEILPDEEVKCDRSLISTRFREATGYAPPSWQEMLDEMAQSSPFYERIRR